jgi:hypothetical protein
VPGRAEAGSPRAGRGRKPEGGPRQAARGRAEAGSPRAGRGRQPEGGPRPEARGRAEAGGPRAGRGKGIGTVSKAHGVIHWVAAAAEAAAAVATAAAAAEAGESGGKQAETPPTPEPRGEVEWGRGQCKYRCDRASPWDATTSLRPSSLGRMSFGSRRSRSRVLTISAHLSGSGFSATDQMVQT